MSDCPFCLETAYPYGDILTTNDHAYLITNPDPVLQASLMIIPLRHVETPFDLNDAEWKVTKLLLDEAKLWLDGQGAEGYTVGWNVGMVAGQHIPHAHLHVIGRFADEPLAGRGLRHALKQPENL